MAYATPALVGTIGAVSTGASGAAVTPAWGTSENRTAGNLLVLQVAVTGSATLPTAPSGWSGANALAGTTCSASIYYKVATGADTAPTIAAITSGIINARLSEYSGMAVTSPQSTSGSAAGTTTPQKATNAAVDITSPALMVSAVTMLNSSARTVATFTETYTNGTSISTNNAATSTASHYGFSYSNTTAHAVADADSFAFTTTQVTGVAVSLASFVPLFSGVSTGAAAGTFTATAVGNVFVPGAWAIAQQTVNVTASGNGTVTPTQALSSLGTTMLVVLSVDISSPTEPITSVKDAAGNSFAQLGVTVQVTDHGWLELWGLATPVGDVGTRPAITVTSGLTNFGIATQFFEVFGILPGTDGTPTANGASASPATNGAYSSTVANELLFFMYGDSGYNSTASLPTGYTASTANVQSNNQAQLSTWYKNSTGGAESASSTLSTAAHWSSLMVALRLVRQPGTGALAGTFTASATGTWSVPLVSGTGAMAGTLAATATGTWAGPTLPGTAFITNVGGSIITRTWINDFIGMAILVGPAPLVVSALGRYVISGNTQTHVVKLIDGATGTDIPGGAVTVNTTSVPVNTFVYAALASPITLAANTQYFVASFESDSSGDSFLEVYDTLTGTAAAQFTYAYHSGVWSVGSSYNSTAYGPVNFLYSTPPVSTGTYASTVLADGPVFYWRLDELTGITAADATGNALIGTYSSGVTLGELPAVQDGTSMYVVPPNGVSIPDFLAADTYPFSVEMWVQVTYVGQWGTLFGKVTNSGWGDGFACYSVGDPNWKFWVGNYTVAGVVFSMPDASGVFTHLVCTYDGTTGNIYLNGALAASAPIALGASNVAPFWVGEDGNGFGLNAYFDEVAFYSYRLSPTSIANHYTVGTTPVAAVTVPGTGTSVATFTASAIGSVVFPSAATMVGNFSASATGTWVTVVHGSGSVLGTFTANGTGAVVFSVPGGLTGIFAATATGTSRLPGAGTATGAFAASSTGLVTVQGAGALAGTFTASAATTGSGSLLGAFAATSTGLVVVPSHATLTGAFAGSAAGALAGFGQASGSFTALAQGISIDPATGTYVGTFTGLATGAATPVALGTGAISGIFASSAQGLVTAKGSGSVVGAFTASAAGTLAGAGTALIFFNATATSLVTVSGSGTAAGVFLAQGTASIPGLALGTGAIVGTFSASGTALVKIASAAGLTGTFAGNATSVLIGPLAATGLLATTFIGSATGTSALPGSSAVVSTFTASATGALNKVSSASLTGSFTAMATGAASSSSSSLLVGSFMAIAVGAVNQLGSGAVLGAFLGMAAGRVAENPPMSILVDDFNSGVFDPTMWVVNPPWFGFNEPVTIVNGQVNITVVDDFSYGGLESVGYFDLTESSVFTQFVSAGDQTTTLDVYPIFMSDANLNVMGWECTGGTLYMMFPGQSSIPIPYDPGVHKWLRVRETGDYLYFDYSTDGTTWANAYNDVDPPTDAIDLTALQCGFVVGADGSAGLGMTALFDNLNIVPIPVGAAAGDAAGTFRAHAIGFFTTPLPPQWMYLDRSAQYSYSDEVLGHTSEAVPIDVSYSDAYAMSVPSSIIPGPYSPSGGGGTWVGSPLPIMPAFGAMTGSFVTRATGALTAVGTAVAMEDFEASGVGTIVLVAEASGSKIGTFSASATGLAASPGSGGTSYVFAASANGAWSLSATGLVLGTFSAAGAPVLTLPFTPFSSIVSTFAATSTGLVTAHGAASVTGAFVASATGRWSIPAAGALADAFTASATGTITLVSQGHGAVGGTFTATATAVWAAAFTLSVIPGTPRADYDGWVGMEIVASSPMTVTALGRWVLSGNANNHVVDLCSASGDVIGSVTVNTNGRPQNAFTYAPLSPPVPLAAGATYFLISQEVNGGDYWYGNDTAITTTTDAADQFPAYGTPGSGGVLPGGSLPNTTFVPVDFLYQRLTGPVSMSVWDGAEPVGSTTYTDSDIANLGVVFQSSVPGSILGVQFYKAVGVTATHTGALWDANGDLLASGTFTNETSSGWQVLYFANPVPIVPGVNYTASYNDGDPSIFGFTNGGLTTGLTNGLLTVPNSGGVYAYGDTNTFPNTISTITPNYWVDVLFGSTYGTGFMRGAFTATANGTHS